MREAGGLLRKQDGGWRNFLSLPQDFYSIEFHAEKNSQGRKNHGEWKKKENQCFFCHVLRYRLGMDVKNRVESHDDRSIDEKEKKLSSLSDNLSETERTRPVNDYCLLEAGTRERKNQNMFQLSSIQ